MSVDGQNRRGSCGATGRAARARLLAGTALASTLLLAAPLAPSPAAAQQAVNINSTNAVTVNNSKNCVFAGICISIETTGIGSSIDLYNSGRLNGGLAGIFARTDDGNSPIKIVNVGDILSNNVGIAALASGYGSPISITNSAKVQGRQFAINAQGVSNVSVLNTGDLLGTGGLNSGGIFAATVGPGRQVYINNTGSITTTGTPLVTSGLISLGGHGMQGFAGNIAPNASIQLKNSGKIQTSGDLANGMFAIMYEGSSANLLNTGHITTKGSFAAGMIAYAPDTAPNVSVRMTNTGDIEGEDAAGMFALLVGPNSRAYARNDGSINANDGIALAAVGPTTIRNTGDVVSKRVALQAQSVGPTARVIINNEGSARSTTSAAVFAVGVSYGGPGSPSLVLNSGTLFGQTSAVYAYGNVGAKIVNTGDMSSGTGPVIRGNGSRTVVANAGTITGYLLFNQGQNNFPAQDAFINQAGGTFEARLTSDFGPLTDVFRNHPGATVHTASGPGAQTTSFVNLELFDNKGLISLVDSSANDVFALFNTVGANDMRFVGSDNSTVALDVFLGGAGSPADRFIINGNVSGRTAVEAANVNPGGGVFNTTGIPVIFVNGNVNPNAFYMQQPADGGLFDYDLFFVPTGSGFFELRSFPGGGSHVLPELLTAAQDIFHATNETWFDRTADLRVLLNGGAPVRKPAPDGAADVTPATWIKASGTWLEQDDSAATTAYGRRYRYDLERDLSVGNFEFGVDLGKPDLLAPGDLLVFGLLGGAVLADLGYEHLLREFDFQGGEVGVYATYLKGGLFVDTLAKVDFLDLESEVRGMPHSLQSTTGGIRTDAGYRFGSFRGGPFIEPLATIAVSWTDLDNFRRDGNVVTFDPDADVRGRLGLRVGTSYEAWEGAVFEPFVIGSVWGNFAGDNAATVTSTGTTFRFSDEPEDVWAVVSTGFNLFNPGASTEVFAKLDVTLGEDTTGVGARGGMRVHW